MSRKIKTQININIPDLIADPFGYRLCLSLDPHYCLCFFFPSLCPSFLPFSFSCSIFILPVFASFFDFFFVLSSFVFFYLSFVFFLQLFLFPIPPYILPWTLTPFYLSSFLPSSLCFFFVPFLFPSILFLLLLLSLLPSFIFWPSFFCNVFFPPFFLFLSVFYFVASIIPSFFPCTLQSFLVVHFSKSILLFLPSFLPFFPTVEIFAIIWVICVPLLF